MLPLISLLNFVWELQFICNWSLPKLYRHRYFEEAFFIRKTEPKILIFRLNLALIYVDVSNSFTVKLTIFIRKKCVL